MSHCPLTHLSTNIFTHLLSSSSPFPAPSEIATEKTHVHRGATPDSEHDKSFPRVFSHELCTMGALFEPEITSEITLDRAYSLLLIGFSVLVLVSVSVSPGFSLGS